MEHTKRQCERKERKTLGKEKKGTDQALMYLGPTFYGRIQKGAVFRGGYPGKATELLEQYPFLRGLFVPVDQIAERKKQIRSGQGELSALYQKAMQTREGKHV